MPDLQQRLEELRRAVQALPEEADPDTIADLEKLGPGVAYLRVKREFPQASLNLLWALAAGLADVDWRELPEAERERLLANLGAG